MTELRWRKYDNMFSRFDTIPERNGRMDRQNFYINIAHQHCCADER